MTQKTEAELRFEDLCARAELACTPIPTSKVHGERTADYRLAVPGYEVVAEVKQFDPNPEEARANTARAAGKYHAMGGKPGDRVRKAIRSGAPQLKRISEGRLPAMLVVYNASGVSMHTAPYSVATAMDGFDVIDVLVPKEVSEPLQFGAARSGPGKKMTESDNTTISAIAVLGYNLDESLRLDVYHNRHARNPLRPELLRAPQVSHWRRPDGGRSSTAAWEPM